ncbi:MAG: hypothetical protein M1409_08655, partial [Actinobacteria bacterium]|nr:hypothetical protein [Actinomycetota bacterium]
MKQNALKNKLVIYALLVAIVIFNFYLYRAEFTVKSDPNDNIFHYALIDEAHSIWKNIFAGKMSPFYLFDSWNFRWGEGLALSTYYNHLPQAAIALLNFVLPIDSYQLYVVIRTLMFILLPLSFYWAVRILDLPDYFGVMVAFFSQVIITDGLYGIDVSSFIYRGWGLSAQLMAVFFLPQAFAYTIRYLKDKKDLFKAILFNFIVAQCHFGLLLLLLIGYPFYFLFELAHWKEVGKRLLIFLSLIFLTLSYFILPFFTLGLYRNYSYWDNIWKFNSWGINQV